MRLWLVLSIFYVLAAVVAYAPALQGAAEDKTFKYSEVMSGHYDSPATKVWRVVGEALPVVLLPPTIALALGCGLFWAIAGFTNGADRTVRKPAG